MKSKNKITWLNCSKFVAMLAVMIDHTHGILYTNSNIAYASYFSVGLFVILSGMTSYLSNSRHEENWWKIFCRGCRDIIVSYCIAVVVYMLVGSHEFDLLQYLNYLINFNITGPHYFISLYIQLMIASKILYSLLKKCSHSIKGYGCEVIILGIIIVFASWSVNYTNILNIYGGGGKLFGGTYLILYYFGMLVMHHDWFRDTSAIKSAVFLIIMGSAWFFLWKFMCTNGMILEHYAPFGEGINPPGVTFMILGICMLFITFGVFTLLERIKCLKKAVYFIGWCGNYTLYIFLYHKLLLDYFLIKYMGDLPTINKWIVRVVYFAVMIFGCILIELIVRRVQRFINELSTSRAVTDNVL